MKEFIQTGGCQCGQIRYMLKKRPEVIYCCHCTEYQKQTSSAFGISVRVEASALSIEGNCDSFERQSASGVAVCEFCPSCGTRLFHRRPTYADKLNIKGGSFDDTSWINPAGHIWTVSKQTWLALPEHALAYDRQPENYNALIAAYQQDQ